MDDVYFYQPDNTIKYINECTLWVLGRSTTLMMEDRKEKKWLEPMWMQANDMKGIVVYISKIDAEIAALHARNTGESWRVYPLDDFNVTEMMNDNRLHTGNNSYNFLFSFGFWLNTTGALIAKEHVLSQALVVEGFRVDSRYNTGGKIIIRFSHDNFNFMVTSWNNKIKSHSEYKEYLGRVNKHSACEAEKQARLALSKIEICKTTEYIPVIAGVWSVVDEKWIMSNLNNSVN